MTSLFLLYFALYTVASWTYWQEGAHLSFSKYTIGFSLGLIAFELFRMYS